MTPRGRKGGCALNSGFLAVSYIGVIKEKEMGERKQRLTPEEQAEFDNLTESAKRIQERLEELKNKPMVYGYIRVSSKGQAKEGNSLEGQRKAVEDAGAQEIFTDVFTGTTTQRPELEKLLSIIKCGDTIIVTRLDRIARSVQQGIALIDELVSKGIRVHVINMGVMDDSPTGKLIRNVMLCFAEFDREMILQRTREGREIARRNPEHREGRKPRYSDAQLKFALKQLKDYSYNDVARMTGISKSTLIRAKKAFERNGGLHEEKQESK